MPPKKKMLPKIMPVQQPKTQLNNKESAKHCFQQNRSIYGCISHPQKYLKLQPLDQKSQSSPIYCKSCGFKISGQYYLTCEQNKCFNLCSSCKICRQNHFLGKVFSIKNILSAAPLSFENIYACSVCKQQRQMTNQGVRYCTTCDYSICPLCLQHESNLWENYCQ